MIKSYKQTLWVNILGRINNIFLNDNSNEKYFFIISFSSDQLYVFYIFNYMVNNKFHFLT
jgi:hypothetical protein